MDIAIIETPMTTIEIAKKTGKRHDHVIQDAEIMLTELYGIEGCPIPGATYAIKGRKHKCYELSLKDTQLLFNKYTLRAKSKKTNLLYIFKCKNNYKIGITYNIKARIRNLQVGNPYLISEMYAFKVKHPKAIEALINDEFKNKKLLGEWFELSENDILTILNIIKSKQ